MTDRTFQWWKMKLGFQGDPEFVQLAILSPGPTAYAAAIGVLLLVYDAAHKSDSRTPRGTILAPYGDQVALLASAGLLEADGTIPSRTWSKYRVEDRVRGDRGRFIKTETTTIVAPRGVLMVTNTETEREPSEEGDDEERSTSRTARGGKPVPLSDELAKKPWNRRK